MPEREREHVCMQRINSVMYVGLKFAPRRRLGRSMKNHRHLRKNVNDTVFSGVTRGGAGACATCQMNYRSINAYVLFREE